ncbi:M48 family metalloprotease [uncultured Cardiobacterium sp.]|uniref:M48 family metalloprotease n=1 Tax=uncultured Cardiobacterium sp. TaxID=417619 RepID=UPI002602A0CC|nr:M48 family metalloprotease [uncultured Cardiobacterium sp.]
MKKPLVILLATLAACGVHAADIELPDLGNPEKRIFSGDKARNIGMAVEGRLRQNGELLEQPEITQYVRELGNRLGKYAPAASGYHFFVIDSPAINAFATGGGYIGINSGLIAMTDNEDQLAGVIAHEIGHVSQSHIARSIANAEKYGWMQAIGMLAGIAVAAAGDSPQGAQAAIIGSQAYIREKQLEYSRAHEQQADDVAVKILRKAGYDEAQMAVFFEKLMIHGSQPPEFLLTHPLPQNRIDRQLAKAEKNKSTRNPLDYQLAKAAIGRYSRYKQREFQPADPLAAQYRRALDAQRRYDRAALADILSTLPADKNAAFARLHGEEALANGNNQNAENILGNAWRRWRNNENLIIPYARSLMASGKYREAEKLLQGQIARDPGAVQYYDLYGELLDREHRSAEQFLLSAKYYALIGDYKLAEAQVSRALKDPTLPDNERQKVSGLQKRYEKMKEEAENEK